jgi:hypothetical protein
LPAANNAVALNQETKISIRRLRWPAHLGILERFREKVDRKYLKELKVQAPTRSAVFAPYGAKQSQEVVTIPVSQALGVYCNNNYPTNGTKLA